MGILDFLLPQSKPQQPSQDKGQAGKQPLPTGQPAEQKTAPKSIFFGSDPYISRESLENKAKKMPGQVEGFWQRMTAEQRKEKTRELFGQGGHLTREAYVKKLKDLEKQRQLAKTYAEKEKIKNQIKFYQALDKAA